jgi:hypothetical protein
MALEMALNHNGILDFVGGKNSMCFTWVMITGRQLMSNGCYRRWRSSIVPVLLVFA